MSENSEWPSGCQGTTSASGAMRILLRVAFVLLRVDPSWGWGRGGRARGPHDGQPLPDHCCVACPSRPCCLYAPRCVYENRIVHRR
eukprot:1944974-Prymnesium_polylepis.1